jgi:methylenetetrahydrofolate reductase (NADPH)
LVNIVHNDFRNTTGIFPLFEGLRVSALDDAPVPATNGHSETELNGGAVLDKAGPKPELDGVPDHNNAVNGANDAAASAPTTNGDTKH